MLSIGMIKKLSGGNVGPDEIAELLSSMGIDLEVQHIDEADMPAAFQDAAIRTRTPGAGVIRLSGKLKNGDRLDALMVVQPGPAIGVRRIEKTTEQVMRRFEAPAAPRPEPTQ